MAVTAAEDSPGTFSRIPLVDPPYCAPVVDPGQHDQRRDRVEVEGDGQQ
jgi:hypothetical protein